MFSDNFMDGIHWSHVYYIVHRVVDRVSRFYCVILRRCFNEYGCSLMFGICIIGVRLLRFNNSFVMRIIGRSLDWFILFNICRR